MFSIRPFLDLHTLKSNLFLAIIRWIQKNFIHKASYNILVSTIFLVLPQFIYLYKGQLCQVKRCSRTKCRDDAWCNKNSGKDQYNCVEGKCVLKTVCNRDGDCPPNNYCEENECIPEETDSSTPKTRDFVPIKQCKKHRDCDRGDFCRNGKCESSCEKVPVGLNSWFLIWP